MAVVEVDEETYGRLAFAAGLFGVSVGEVIARLVDRAGVNVTDGPAVDSVDEPDVPVHVIYRGERIAGVFERSSGRLRVTSGDLAGQVFPSPSAAAIGVVERLNPERRNPQTNGRLFWIVDSTQQPLRSIMGRR
ncbi:hypothetical protein [Micromonospora orduensis]|uniref:hypothetical protein n=1 Tax=Micromonospora orduensis TaxID=1420891 RepID=UPI0033C90078